MTSEIEVPETPNWLQELEAKRERRVKARLGHETGAGAPCLKCGEKCPGLDLHFWRKCCKICKCSKEEHEVQDDDIYGWAQFQLLGSKPNKIKRKIVLPGKKDELELEWAPKGHSDTVEKYLKTLPPEQLPVKGTQAAQDRKQLLQKQIPIHDIDPTLCHELSEEELRKMNEYIAHIKQSSVGVGQIVSLSSIIKGNLHKLNPSEAAIIASRYAKGVPLSEIVKLQSQSRAVGLNQQALTQNLENLSLNNVKTTKSLPNFAPNSIRSTEYGINPMVSTKIHEVNYPSYVNYTNQSTPNPQYSSDIKSGQYRNDNTVQSKLDPSSNERYMQNPNFDPKKVPSQFNSNVPSTVNSLRYNSENISDKENSAFVPYSKISSKPKQPDSYGQDNYSPVSHYSSGLHKSYNNPCRTNPGNTFENIDSCGNQLAELKPSSNIEENFGNQSVKLGSKDSSVVYENVEKMKKNVSQALPNYAPSKYNIYSDPQSPAKIPKNVKDLAFSTYQPDKFDPSKTNTEHERPKISYENYPSGLWPGNNSGDGKSVLPADTTFSKFTNPNIFHSQSGNNMTVPQYPSEINPDLNSSLEKHFPSGNQAAQIGKEQDVRGGHLLPSNYGSGDSNISSNYPSDLYNKTSPGQNIFLGPDGDVFKHSDPGSHLYDPKAPGGQSGHIGINNPGTMPYEYNIPQSKDQNTSFNENSSETISGNSTGKPLLDLQPGKINVCEDFLLPSQVTIGAIQDINYPEIKAATHGTNDFYEDYSPESIREILNNIKLPDCHYCKKPFEENEFAVAIDRASVLFHAECFRCAGCNQILADNVYFYNKETDNIYCGRDYAKIRGFPRCKACDELIFTKEYCLAENSTFHLKHFCCIECDTPLAGQDYTLEDEMPYCLPCFEQSKANKCSACCRVIKPDEVGCNLNGVHFHAVDNCFACKICRKPLMGKKLLLRNQKLYCSHECFGADK